MLTRAIQRCSKRSLIPCQTAHDQDDALFLLAQKRLDGDAAEFHGMSDVDGESEVVVLFRVVPEIGMWLGDIEISSVGGSYWGDLLVQRLRRRRCIYLVHRRSAFLIL